ncbi:Nramp family divalent metal transporter [Tamlana fucoidanivorans]|uniref:Divalent metal cation transporter n=1 Tax=Allotamlana fucoidanivorans TaxID=2583814 RepID=A0A5C4SIT6_9FLAO|nr:Nramp family divalent metal transporter [Tamlana fucoidanivorans]TNJ42964.1 divalent metal cation transporter [Tamlana fucoidanivorans]
MIKKWFKNMGPGPLVAAAFIGPGTVTVCTLAGVGFGYTLLWAMVLSILATIVLQEMAARLGIVAQKGLSEIIRTEIQHPIIKLFVVLLILSAIVIGNAAYQAGNISGGVLGLETVLEHQNITVNNLTINPLNIILGVCAFALLYLGNYKVLEKVLISLVLLMSLSFLYTAIVTKPNIVEVLQGALIPIFPEGSLLTIIALIGTTVVPYNLFLHASLVKEKWHSEKDLKWARRDTVLSVILGGIVSICIIVSATAIQATEINNATDLAKGLEPLYGSYAKYFLGIGLFAAGITSAITAPLAAAYVATGCLGWARHMKGFQFRMVWMGVLLLGVCISSLGINPIEIIKFAQVANGILLPVIVGFLIWIMNKHSVLGLYKNKLWQNILGGFILIFSIFLSMATLNKVLGLNIF